MNVKSVKFIVLLIEVTLPALKFFLNFPATGEADFGFLQRNDKITVY